MPDVIGDDDGGPLVPTQGTCNYAAGLNKTSCTLSLAHRTYVAVAADHVPDIEAAEGPAGRQLRLRALTLRQVLS